MTHEGQIPGEQFTQHERIQVYVERVENTTKGPQIYVSRTHPNIIKRLFEQEVPEIYDGTVEIKAIAREAGDRSKVAVYSHDPNIDAVGTAVGQRGQRVQTVVNELRGENMDIVEWDEDPEIFISHALNPAQVLEAHFVPNEKSVVIVVPDDHLSLAIGRRGQNVRLAARLTGYKIDIKSASEWETFQDSPEYDELFVVTDAAATDAEVQSDTEVTETSLDDISLDELFDESAKENTVDEEALIDSTVTDEETLD